MFITSRDIAAYVRLHLLSRVLSEHREGKLCQAGESVIMAMIRLLEEEWAYIQDEGPPEMSHVLRHMLPSRSTQTSSPDDNDTQDTMATNDHKKDRRRGGVQRKE